MRNSERAWKSCASNLGSQSQALLSSQDGIKEAAPSQISETSSTASQWELIEALMGSVTQLKEEIKTIKEENVHPRKKKDSSAGSFEVMEP